ncbi:MAG: hypothetical protein ABIW94_11975 [Gemmatimonadaceae bacterium]
MVTEPKGARENIARPFRTLLHREFDATWLRSPKWLGEKKVTATSANSDTIVERNSGGGQVDTRMFRAVP